MSRLIAFRSKRNGGAFVCPHCVHPSKFLAEAFKDATSNPFGYLLFDLKPDTGERYRIRTNIFLRETQFVYLVKLIKDAGRRRQ